MTSQPFKSLGQTARRILAAITPPIDARSRGRYDRLIDAANRLPRPVLVFGTLALFALAVLDPATFDRVMTSLRQMPEELWWLAAAVFAGHFGAREAHHLRQRPKDMPKTPPHSAP
jgi:hypothetical protein